MINGASVVAQSVVALLCTGILTSIIYLLCSATHTQRNRQACFIFASDGAVIRNTGMHKVQRDLEHLKVMLCFVLFFGQA